MKTYIMKPSSRGWMDSRSLVINLLVASLVVGGLTLAQSCSKSPPSMDTGKVLANTEVRLRLEASPAYFGDSSYAVVSSAWLSSFYDEFKSEIFRHGVTRWDSRFDCNHFAAYYVALAQTEFYAKNFQSGTKAQSLAVGIFWYMSSQGGHAIVIALTEKGLIFIEPQTGKEVNLTPLERSEAYLIVF